MVDVRSARIFITGASGFIGSHFTRRLVSEGAEVHVLNASVSSVYPGRLVDLRRSISVHEGNLIDHGALHRILKNVRPQVIVHLGAYTHVAKSWQRIDECFQVNVLGTVNLLEAAADVGYERLVNVGSSEIYGGIEVPFREDAAPFPTSPYSVSKYAAERICQITRTGQERPIVMVRPFNTYGPAQATDRIVPEIIVRALQRQPLKLTTGRQTREFNHVDDICDGLTRLISTPGIDGELFNLGCGEEVSVRDLTELILGMLDDPVEPQFGALPHRPNEIWRMVSDSSKARTLLGWAPQLSLHDGLRRTVDWYEEELKQKGSPYVAFDPPATLS